MAYCSNADVGVLLELDYNAIAKPTPTQVDSLIDQVTAEIDSRLAAQGVALPITDATTLLLLKKYCSFGSACIVGYTYFRNNESTSDSQASFYCVTYQQFLTDLKDDPETVLGALDINSTFMSNQVLDGTTTESDLTDNGVEDVFKW